MNTENRARPHGPQEYKGNGKHDWELVTRDFEQGAHTSRLRVPGGWLYRSAARPDAVLTFVPVPEVVGYAI